MADMLYTNPDPYGAIAAVSGPSPLLAPQPTIFTAANPDAQQAPAQPTPDPYAQWGGQTAYNNLRSGFNNQKSGILSSANTAADNSATSYKNSILDWAYGLNKVQQGINNKGVNAEMAKSQGTQGVLGMVGRGIRSGGVTLANKNAGDSSAAQAIANAYGDVGRRAQSSVNNQYGQEINQIGLDQADLEAQRSLGLGKFNDQKNQTVNSIVAEAEQSLSALDAQIANASLPDRIAIEQEKQNIRNSAMSKLQAYDAMLAQKNAEIRGSSAEERRTEAQRLAQQGQASNLDFNYTTEAPAQFQGTGPYASELPLFTFKNRRIA